MAEQLRTRRLKEAAVCNIWLSYNVTWQKETSIAGTSLIPADSIIHEKLMGSEWFLHNDKGPAVIFDILELFYLEGVLLDKEEWLEASTKLGKILYD
jgi:hypothetical protein